MSDERNPHESGPKDQDRRAADEVEDLEVSSDVAEDVKGGKAGLSDFTITKKFDKSSPSIGGASCLEPPRPRSRRGSARPTTGRKRLLPREPWHHKFRLSRGTIERNRP